MFTHIHSSTHHTHLACTIPHINHFWMSKFYWRDKNRKCNHILWRRQTTLKSIHSLPLFPYYSFITQLPFLKVPFSNISQREATSIPPSPILHHHLSFSSLLLPSFCSKSSVSWFSQGALNYSPSEQNTFSLTLNSGDIWVPWGTIFYLKHISKHFSK